MVRINLLPDRRARGGAGRASGSLWLLVGFAMLLLELAGIGVVHALARRQLAAAEAENLKTQAQIDVIRRQIADHAEVRARLDDCRSRDEAISRLQAARTGPTAALLELARVLTPGRGPTVDRAKLERIQRESPSAVLRQDWDPRRLWLTAYSEADRTVKLAGLARDGEDVSEFERRLALSDYFYDVKLLPAAKIVDADTKQELVKFELAAKVRY